jgi:hypothetical protein
MTSGADVNFNVLANSPGWDAAQIQANLDGSIGVFTISPSGNVKLDENIHDLQPRAHLYVTAGVTNLPLTFAFNSTNQPDGYHELTAVAYEGSHVRTQRRITQNVRIQNGSLSATFTSSAGGSNIVVGATLQFSVAANTNNISKIELFSTGGALTNIAGQSNAIFSVVGTNLGSGLHPFYAIVTGTNGKQYRTETKWIRFVGTEPPFQISIAAQGVPPPMMSHASLVGGSFSVSASTALEGNYSLVYKNSIADPVWTVAQTLRGNGGPITFTDNTATNPTRFYRILFEYSPPMLTWPATVGRGYEILSTTNLTSAFQVRDSLTATNNAAQWIETNLSAPQRFYRVRTTN